MIVSAVVVSPNPTVLGEPVDIIVLVEGIDPSEAVEVCVSVAWPFEIERRAMLCQTVLGSAGSVSFRTRLSSKTPASTCQITVLAGAEDGQTCTVVEVVDVKPDRSPEN